MRLLEFMFADVWHFFGCLIILIVISDMIPNRPHVNNYYGRVKDSEEDTAEASDADDKAEEKARSDMWKRDV